MGSQYGESLAVSWLGVGRNTRVDPSQVLSHASKDENESIIQ